VAAAATAEEDGLTVIILDTVTGRILHHQHHSGACGPVATAFFDNQAMLQFWDARSFRWHFSVMELYEHGVPLPSTLNMVTGARWAVEALGCRGILFTSTALGLDAAFLRLWKWSNEAAARPACCERWHEADAELVLERAQAKGTWGMQGH
jgi:hypothetical protein